LNKRTVLFWFVSGGLCLLVSVGSIFVSAITRSTLHSDPTQVLHDYIAVESLAPTSDTVFDPKGEIHIPSRVPQSIVTSKPVGIPTLTPSVTRTSNATPTSFPTKTLFPSPTPTAEATLVLDDGRVWTRGEFWHFFMYLGGHIMWDPYYPEDDNVIHSVIPSVRVCGGNRDECDRMIDIYYQAGIPPAYWCNWAYQNSLKGYGTMWKQPEDGVIVQDRPSGIELWKILDYYVGDPMDEPYCPQLDMESANFNMNP
jgi:hypothetical protein